MADRARYDADAPGHGAGDGLRVAILAPDGSDGSALATAHERWGVPAERVRNGMELAAALAEDRVDLAVLTGEALAERDVEALRAYTDARDDAARRRPTDEGIRWRGAR